MPRILISEDDAKSRRVLQEALESFGYSVVTTRDGAEALKEAEDGPFDLVLTDWVMPRMDGLELCRALKSGLETRELPVALLTTRQTQEDKDTAYATGVDALLTKPFKREALRKQIARLIPDC